LVIRNAQLAVFARARLEEFRQRAVAHVKAAFAARAEELGHAGVEASVETALHRCETYRLASRRDVLRYLNLMYTLGFDFDQDEGHPWAGETLRNPRLEAAAKLELLAQRTRELLRKRDEQGDE
jgi:hypothetical protein